jgi:LacI family transcriptional regulator
MKENKKRLSIYDIAKKAGVGIATVSRVLNNSEFVKDSTRKRVLKIIEELDYRPDFFARSLAKQESRTIALLIPDIINPVFSEMSKGISDEAFTMDYTVFLCNTDSSPVKESKFVKNLLNKRVDGFIFIATEMSKYDGSFEHYFYLQSERIPTIFVNGMVKNLDIPFVRIDEKKAGYMAALHMLNKGLKRIAFLGGSLNFIPTKEKLKGFEKAFRDKNLKVNKEYIILDNFDQASGYKDALRLLEMKKRPEGIITGSDVLAIEVIKAAKVKNINVPGDLQVIGFDDINLARQYNPQITTIAQPKYEMGKIAFSTLLKLIGNKEIENPRLLVKPKLILRESCP